MNTARLHLVIIGLLLFIPWRAVALDLLSLDFKQCLRLEKFSSTIYQSQASRTAIGVVNGRGAKTMCVGASTCTWRISQIPSGMADTLVEQLSADCSEQGWQGANFFSKCRSERVDRLIEQVDALIKSLFGASAMCGADSLSTAASIATEWNQRQYILLPVRDGDGSCIVIAADLSGLSVSAWTMLSCPADQVELAASGLLGGLERWSDAGPTLGAVLPEAGFQVSLVFTEGGDFKPVGVPAVWGFSDARYVSEWFIAALSIAGSATSFGESKDDPIPKASQDRFLGRAARWTLAGSRQVVHRPFDASVSDREIRLRRQSMRWMGRLVLAIGDGSERAFLRGELARQDWSQYEKGL